MKNLSPAKKKITERDSALPLAKLLKLFRLIALLKAGRWTIRHLTERMDSSKSSLYRYLELLEEAGFALEKDFHDRYFILSADDDPLQAQFTNEEMSMLRAMVQTDAHHPLAAALLKKLTLHTEVNAMPQLFLKTYLSNLVEQLTQAMHSRHRVILKNYHSANSQMVSDRLVEPIQFGTNFGTLIALDVKQKICKQFKLDRIGEIKETHTRFQLEHLHAHPATDLFGISGNPSALVSLRLSARAYLLMKEEHPAALPYLSVLPHEVYEFHGPVAHYAGIGRFVLGLIDEIDVLSPEEFKKYLKKKMRGKIREQKNNPENSS